MVCDAGPCPLVGLIGLIVERLIQWLYGRMIDTSSNLGLSAFIYWDHTSIFGASTSTVISPPLGTVVGTS